MLYKLKVYGRRERNKFQRTFNIFLWDFICSPRNLKLIYILRFATKQQTEKEEFTARGLALVSGIESKTTFYYLQHFINN